MWKIIKCELLKKDCATLGVFLINWLKVTWSHMAHIIFQQCIPCWKGKQFDWVAAKSHLDLCKQLVFSLVMNLAIQMSVEFLTCKFDGIWSYKFTASEMVYVYE
jgi:hypothetical protein